MKKLNCAVPASVSKIINWMKEHNGQVSLNPIEQRYGIWIQNLRKAKKGQCKGVFYPSTEKIFAEAGYSNIF